MSDLEATFYNIGVKPPANICWNQGFKTCGTLKHTRSSNGRYIAHELDRFQTLIVFNWETGAESIYKNYKLSDLNNQEKYQINKFKKDSTEQLLQEKQEALLKCIEEYKSLPLAKASHFYLVKKQIDLSFFHTGIPLKTQGSSLVIPIFSLDDQLQSIQTITEDGKRFFKGCSVTHGMYKIGFLEKATHVFIAEGFATAASIYQSVSDIQQIAVICAFSKSNLKNVAKSLHAKYQTKKYILVADNDENEGSYKECLKIQEQYQSMQVYLPSEIGQDANDIYCTRGKDALAEELALFLTASQIKKQLLVRNVYTKDDGIYCREKVDRDDVCIARPIEKAVSITVDDVLYESFKFTDEIGEAKEVVVASGELADPRSFAKIMLNNGYKLLPSYSGKLLDYLAALQAVSFKKGTKKIGWHDADTYILPHFSTSNDTKYYGESIRTFKERGTVEEWKTHIADKCVGINELECALGISFASILVHFCNISFGMHFFGRTGIGKSTLLHVAGSVFGAHDFAASWAATKNGLEVLSEESNNALLALDEFSRVGRAQLDCIYTLFNGTGKARATKKRGSEVSLERIKKWNIAAISTGEKSLQEKAAELQVELYGGEIIRLLDIHIPDFYAPREVINRLIQDTNKYCGTAVQSFVKYIVAHKLDILALISEQYEIDIKQYETSSTSDALRVLKYFSIIQVALNIAQNAMLINQFLDSRNVLKIFERWKVDKNLSLEEISMTDKILDIRDNPTKYFVDSDNFNNEIKTGKIGFYIYMHELDTSTYYAVVKPLNDYLKQNGGIELGMRTLRKHKLILEATAGVKKYKGHLHRVYKLNI